MICVPMRARLPGRSMTHQSLAAIFLEQQHFKLPAGPGIRAAQTGGNHARIVQHQHVAGAEKSRQIPELPVFDAPVRAMQNQQARFIAARRGMLRDQLRRQVKIEISGSHAASFKFQVASFKPCMHKISIQAF